MRRNVYVLMVMILAAVLAAAASAQDVTEPAVPVTLEVTIQPPIGTTTEPTAEASAQATAASTAEATSEMTAQPTAEATSELPVTPEMTSVPTDNSAYLRVAHFAPDAPAVDVYFNDTIAIRNLTYPSISEWIAVDPATYSIAVVPTGQSTDSAAFTPVEVSADSGTWKTVAVVGSSNGMTLQAATITEDYSTLLPSTGGFTFFNALEGSAPVNLVRNKAVYFAQIGFPGPNSTSSSSSLVGDSGTFDVSVVDPNDPSTVFAHQSALELPENAYTLVALIGTADNPQLYVSVTDESAVEIAEGKLPKPGTLIDALRANDNLTAFADALQSAGLTDLLTGSTQYTILAPANFVVDSSMTAEQQANTLRSYIIEGKYTSKQLLDAGTLTALDGTTLTVTTDNNAIYVNSVQVIDLNIAATNGVIHMINGLWSSAPAQ